MDISGIFKKDKHKVKINGLDVLRLTRITELVD